ncbi:MAG: leucine-rich repeat cysteine-containing subtype [Planctomycetaceae bacterium]|nr:leucine-rich repeat cysteine-containing subtype [Planctomycetaceae bacterium]
MPNPDLDSPTASAPLSGGLRITDDTPGTLLRLSWLGPAPWRWVRLAVPFVLLAFILWTSGENGVWHLAWKQINAPGPRDLFGDLLLGGMACLGISLLWICGRVLGQSIGFWDEICFDANEQFFTAHRRGYLIWGRRSVELAFAQINLVTLAAGKEGRGVLPYSLSMRYRSREDKHRHWDADFTLRGQNRRIDACELLQAIGRILAARGYIVREDAPSRAMWQLALRLVVADVEPSPVDDEDDEFDAEDDDEPEEDLDSGEEDVILPISDVPDLERRAESQGVRQLPPVNQQLAAEVNIAALNEKTMFTKVADWIPGERVQFVTAQAPMGVFVVAAVFGALVGGGIGGWPVYGFLDSMLGRNVLWWPGALAISSLLGACSLGFIAWNQFQERVVEFDWRNRQVLYRLGSDLQERSFDDIRGVVLSGTIRREYTGSEHSRTVSKVEYGSRLDLILADRDVPLIASDDWEPDEQTARKILQPLGNSLAQALGLKCQWESSRTTDADTIRRVLTLTTMQQAILAALVILAVGGIGNGWWQQRTQQVAVQAVRQTAADVVFMSGFSLRDKVVYKDYWKVEFKEDPQVDEHLTQIRGELLKLPEFGLTVEKGGLTDQGLQQLDQQTGLRVLDVSQSRITDASLPAVGTCSNLVYLNLFGTGVSDTGLEHLAKLQKLRFLYLGGTAVSDAGLATLKQCKSLEYVHLTTSAVTLEGAAKLRNQLPWVQVDFEVFKQ